MISIIVVVGKNREIGLGNRLLWELPKDMARFKRLTTGHTVVMGEKTYQSIGRPLPKRKNIVLSLDQTCQAPGCEVRNSLEEVLAEAKKSKDETFVIGGGIIYKLALPFADKLYLTVIDDAPEADTFFPDYSEFSKIVFQEKGTDNGLDYTFYELMR